MCFVTLLWNFFHVYRVATFEFQLSTPFSLHLFERYLSIFPILLLTQIPHELCLYEGPYRLCPLHKNYTFDKCQHLCKEFVPECPRGTIRLADLQGVCRPLLEFNVNVPLRLGKSNRVICTNRVIYTNREPQDDFSQSA